MKGKAVPLGLYECFEGDLPEVLRIKRKQVYDFNAGFRWYCEKDFAKAEEMFEKLVNENPSDSLLKYCLENAIKMQQVTVAADWSPTEAIEVK